MYKKVASSAFAAKRLVVIGGGTGSFTVLQAVKSLTPNLTALVSMADDGGSTGILRDELGVLPPGDIRQCLVALANAPQLRDLFNYRFDGGSLAGHSFGNLLLTALEKQTGSFVQAVETASQVLNITGKVVPVTLDNVRLVADMAEGVLRGEHAIDVATFSASEPPHLRLDPVPQANPEALQAIAEADVVIIAPGDLYTSLAPALLVPGIGEALAHTTAQVLHICNLVSKPGHTDGMDVEAHAAEIERFAGRPILDVVLYNTAVPPTQLVDRYAKEQEHLVPVSHAPQLHYQLIGKSLLAGRSRVPAPSKADALAMHRSLIRHDRELLRAALLEIVE